MLIESDVVCVLEVEAAAVTELLVEEDVVCMLEVEVVAAADGSTSTEVFGAGQVVALNLYICNW